MGRQHDDLAVIPWYWRDWRASKARAKMSPLARGVYRELLDAHYGEEDCSLQDSEEDLAILGGVDLKTWRKIAPEILPWLPINDEGRRQNPRSVHEWRLARKNRGVIRKKRKAAAKQRWDNEKRRREAVSKSNAHALQMECPPTPTPTPSPSATPTPTPSPSANKADGLPAAQAECQTELEHAARVLARPHDELLAEASRPKGSIRTIGRVDTCTNAEWLRVTADKLRQMRRAGQGSTVVDEAERQTARVVAFLAQHPVKATARRLGSLARANGVRPVEILNGWLSEHAPADLRAELMPNYLRSVQEVAEQVTEQPP